MGKWGGEEMKLKKHEKKCPECEKLRAKILDLNSELATVMADLIFYKRRLGLFIPKEKTEK